MHLAGRKIILGVTGSIAAYKAALLVRLLKKAGAEVQVILTQGGAQFITPLTLSTLSERQVVLTYASPDGQWYNHVEMGLWADVVLIAPATAHTLSQLVRGEADEALLGTVLSARCPVWVAPAMDLDMYSHSATQANLQELQARGVKVLQPESGPLASGLDGPGRLMEPEHIVAHLNTHFSLADRFQGRRVLITAGPTQEALDPVRFVSNHSSGKMGLALAQTFLDQGASVDLVLGPVAQQPAPHPQLQLHPVVTAQEMHQACLRLFEAAHLAVMAAAVADFRPAQTATEKIKKDPDQEEMTLRMVKNPDIAASLGQVKQPHQRLVGFALETTEGQANAQQKLHTKGLDLIVLNSLATPGAGFGHPTNQVTLLGAQGVIATTDLLPKSEIATVISHHVHALLPA